MIKVTTADVIKQLVSRGVFELKKDAEYQIDIKDEQKQINAALADLVTIGDYWNEA